MSSDRALFKHESASVMVTPAEDHYWISHLYSIVPRKGHATVVLQKVVDWADENELVLKLTAKQYGNVHGLTTKQLHTFYQKFGFTGEASLMIREPQSQEKHVL